jgi:hypothetical protein
MGKRKANPNSNAGVGRPDWQDALLVAIEKGDKRPRRAFMINVPNEWVGLIRTAARRRGLSDSAFVRRTAMAFVAADLEIDWDTLMAIEPGMRMESRSGEGLETPRGRGHGGWKIEPHE